MFERFMTGAFLWGGTVILLLTVIYTTLFELKIINYSIISALVMMITGMLCYGLFFILKN